MTNETLPNILMIKSDENEFMKTYETLKSFILSTCSKYPNDVGVHMASVSFFYFKRIMEDHGL